MTYARTRFQTAVLATAGGALLGVGAFIFSPSTESWIGLGVGAGLTIVTVAAFATTGRGAVQRGLDLLLVPIAIWALVSARTIELAGHGASPALVKWLGLSAGSAIFGIGVLALIAHELSVESDLRWALAQLSAREATAEADAPGATADGDGDGDVAAEVSDEAAPLPESLPLTRPSRPVWPAPAPNGDVTDWQPPSRAGA